MKAISLFLLVLVFSSLIAGAEQIDEYTLKERLVKLEEGQRLFRESVNEGFKHVNERFDDINNRFNDINNRFNDVNSRFNDINHRITGLQQLFGILFSVLLATLIGIFGFLIPIFRKMGRIETLLLRRETGGEEGKDEQVVRRS